MNTMGGTSAQGLREAVFKKLARCREDIAHGTADLSGLEDSVRAYCEAVAALPKPEGAGHAKDLQLLMDEIGALGLELKEARDAVGRELEGLSRLREANVAYSRSDAIVPARPRKKEDEE
jgi:hypothetical protein